MMKTIALIFGLLTMGVASQAYADLYHLGAGGCRTPAGGQGIYSVHPDVSWQGCRNLCVQNSQCKAVEYNLRHNGTTNCEVHTQPINHTTGYVYTRDHITTCWGYTP